MAWNYDAEWAEQSSAPNTPATGNWKLYMKSDGLYILDDGGHSYGPLGPSLADVVVDGDGAVVTNDGEVVWQH